MQEVRAVSCTHRGRWRAPCGWVNVRRNYWAYSIGLATVWAVILVVVAGTHKNHLHTFLFVFGGFAIAWVSGTIARYVYPPPKKWSR